MLTTGLFIRVANGSTAAQGRGMPCHQQQQQQQQQHYPIWVLRIFLCHTRGTQNKETQMRTAAPSAKIDIRGLHRVSACCCSI